MILQNLYGTYHQKSRTFLFPILGIRFTANIKPVSTYVSWYGRIKPEDRKLLVVYQMTPTTGYKAFESTVLFANPLFETYYELEDNLMVYVFNLSKFSSDWDSFLKGEYSKFSTEVKSRIRSYFGEGNPVWGFVESFIYPGKYYIQYADLLADDGERADMLKLLTEVVELCDKPNFTKEKLVIPPKGSPLNDDSIPLEQKQPPDDE